MVNIPGTMDPMGRFLECLHAQTQKMWIAYLATKLGSAGDKCIEIHHIH